MEAGDSIVSQTGNGPAKRSVYESVRLEVQGWYGDFNVVEVGENVPNLVGQIPLEYLDDAISEFQSKPEVRGKKIVVYGASKGGELALLLGSKYKEIEFLIRDNSKWIAENPKPIQKASFP